MGLLQQIEAERRGDTVDRVLLGHVLRSLTALGIYQTAFQTPFLQQTTEFYASEGLLLMASSDVPDYLKHAEVCTHARASHVILDPPEASRRLKQAAVCAQEAVGPGACCETMLAYMAWGPHVHLAGASAIDRPVWQAHLHHSGLEGA